MHDMKKFQFPSLTPDNTTAQKQDLSRLKDIKIPIQFVLAETEKTLEEVSFFKKGTYITVDKEAGVLVDVYAGGKKVAKAMVHVDTDNKFVFEIV